MNGIIQMSPVTLRISWIVIFMNREAMEDGGYGEEQRKDGDGGRMVEELKRDVKGFEWRRNGWREELGSLSLCGDEATDWLSGDEATDWLTEESRFDFREGRRFLSSAKCPISPGIDTATSLMQAEGTSSGA